MPAALPRLRADPPTRAAIADMAPIPYTRLWLCALLVLILGGITYTETEMVFGVKFAIIWRAAFAALLVVLLVNRTPADRLQIQNLRPLLFCYSVFCAAPLVSLVSAEVEFADMLLVSAIRVFPLLAWLAFSSRQGVRMADLLLRLFPVFLVLAAPLFLLKILEPRGVVTSLAAIASVEVEGFNSVFQTVHSAGYAHAIATLLAFALVQRARSAARAWPYLLLGVACLALTAATTARAGLLAAIAGMLMLWAAKREVAVPLASLGCLVVVALGVFAARPDLVTVAEGRLWSENQYVKGGSLDSLTSGRLGLQRAALAAYANAPVEQQLFGMGRSAYVKEIERQTGFNLFAHSAFVDELTSNGLFGLLSLLAAFAAAYQRAWAAAKRGLPLSMAMITATLIVAVFQSVDFSLQLSLVGLVMLLDALHLSRGRPAT